MPSLLGEGTPHRSLAAPSTCCLSTPPTAPGAALPTRWPVPPHGVGTPAHGRGQRTCRRFFSWCVTFLQGPTDPSTLCGRARGGRWHCLLREAPRVP